MCSGASTFPILGNCKHKTVVLGGKRVRTAVRASSEEPYLAVLLEARDTSRLADCTELTPRANSVVQTAVRVAA